MTLLEKLKERSHHYKLIIFICLFGTGSWVELNGIWVELPLLVSQSPQGWSLPSYISIVVQIANIGPLLYFCLNKFLNRNKGRDDSRRVQTEIPAIFIILSVGVVASILLAFFWQDTSMINGKSYSSALIVLSFFLALVDCTSSLTFLPFMAYFPAQYLTVYYIGEGMSGFIPSIIALAQGIGGQSYTCGEKTSLQNMTKVSGEIQLRNVTESVPSYFYTKPRFSTRVFFLFIAGMMVLSLTSFALLFRIKKRMESKNNKRETAVPLRNKGFVHEYDVATKNSDQLPGDGGGGDDVDQASEKPGEMSFHQILYLLVINGLICTIGFGILPSLQSYACLPYSNNIYHLTLVLSAVANPLACFMYFLVSVKSTLSISIGALVYVASAGYTIGIAATSPCPIMNDSQIGGIIVVSIFIKRTTKYFIFNF